MTTPQQLAWLDQEDRRVAMKIREYGCYIQYVYGSEPGETPFAYTIGCYGIGHPELLLFGTDQATAGNILNTLFERVRAGSDLILGEIVELDNWAHRMQVEQVPNPEEILLTAYSHYRLPPFLDLPAYQLTWDDRAGRFPTDSGYSVPAWVQPRPGTFRA